MLNKKEYLQIQKQCESKQAKLVAVTKYRSHADIEELYAIGHRDFGENKVQDLVAKQEKFPKDIRWHLIGHLQSNKVKYIIDKVHQIHSVDRLKILKEIQKQAVKKNVVVNCLLQVHVAQEKSKFGIPYADFQDFVNYQLPEELSNIQIKGVMGMATFTNDKTQIEQEFKQLLACFNYLKNNKLRSYIEVNTLSMGMSSDYELALAKGSTMLRVGSRLFKDD